MVYLNECIYAMKEAWDILVSMSCCDDNQDPHGGINTAVQGNFIFGHDQCTHLLSDSTAYLNIFSKHHTMFHACEPCPDLITANDPNVPNVCTL